MMPKYSSMKAGVKRWPADKWFSLCVRHAANYQCESCGGEANENCHIYGRRKFSIRWAAMNCVALCHTCHNRFTGEPCEWTDFIDSRWPGRREQLLIKLRTPGKNTPEIRAAISKHYNKEFRRMEKTGSREFESWN